MDVCQLAAYLIRNFQKNHWSRGVQAVNSEGTPCSAVNPAATRWSVAGLVYKAGGDSWPSINYILTMIQQEAGVKDLVYWNDNTDFNGIRRVLVRVQDRLEGTTYYKPRSELS